MKNFVKVIIDFILIIWAFFSELTPLVKLKNTIQILSEYIYSQRYCKLFKCKNVTFKKTVNWVKGVEYFKIGSGTLFNKQVVLTAWDKYGENCFQPKVNIGIDCNFGDYLHLTCINSITIGDNVLTGRWVTISDNGHGSTDFDSLNLPPEQRNLISKGPIIIGNNVWIGDKATILAGVILGEGSVIAANTVVTKNIPPYSVVAGNPAKVLKLYSTSHNE